MTDERRQRVNLGDINTPKSARSVRFVELSKEVLRPSNASDSSHSSRSSEHIGIAILWLKSATTPIEGISEDC